MKQITLGRTGLVVPQLGFGALPIQRRSVADAVRLLRRAFAGGIRLFDTARMYSDSEEKLGLALADVRGQLVLATKTMATEAGSARAELETSLRYLRTDHVDLYQLHNPERLPDPADARSSYAEIVRAREQGLVRFIGITSHRLALARQAVRSGLFDTLQFPLSHVATPEELELIELCRQHRVGLIAMKALCGGLITDATTAFAFFRSHEDVVPIWGIQHEHELEQFLALERQPPPLDAARQQVIDRDRRELAGQFCRGCGYCLPCPAQIPIPMAARMALLLRRAPHQPFLGGSWPEQMARIRNCTGCRSCADRCPYGLDTPALLQTMLADYEGFLARG